MSKTKELMIVIFFVALSFLYGYNVLHAEESKVAPIEQKCYKNEEFMKLIDEQRLVTLFNASNKDSKVIEVMISRSRQTYIVQYDKSADGNALVAQQYCVVLSATETNFNESAVEFLYNLLEKSKGQKT